MADAATPDRWTPAWPSAGVPFPIAWDAAPVPRNAFRREPARPADRHAWVVPSRALRRAPCGLGIARRWLRAAGFCARGILWVRPDDALGMPILPPLPPVPELAAALARPSDPDRLALALIAVDASLAPWGRRRGPTTCRPAPPIPGPRGHGLGDETGALAPAARALAAARLAHAHARLECGRRYAAAPPHYDRALLAAAGLRDERAARIETLAAHVATWDAVARDGGRVPDDTGAPAELRGVPFAELPNIFRALLAAAAEGFVVAALDAPRTVIWTPPVSVANPEPLDTP